MNSYQNSLIKEHSELIVRTGILYEYIYSGRALEHDDKVEYANKCIQLSSMKKYEECLRARLANVGIDIIDGKYLENVTPAPHVPDSTEESDINLDNVTTTNE